ncbi:MAG: sugar phosphate isomerase/epimerase, partial [Sphaerochaeta sp.]
MKRLVTLASGQFGDVALDSLCALAKEMGYEGIELATHAHFNVRKALQEPGYIKDVKKTLDNYGLQCQAISAHLTGQCVCDVWD